MIEPALTIVSLSAPVWIVAAMSPLLRVAHPRIGQFVQFAVGLARHDCIAPAVGTIRLADYLRDVGTPPQRS